MKVDDNAFLSVAVVGGNEDEVAFVIINGERLRNFEYVSSITDDIIDSIPKIASASILYPVALSIARTSATRDCKLLGQCMDSGAA